MPMPEIPAPMTRTSTGAVMVVMGTPLPARRVYLDCNSVTRCSRWVWQGWA